MGERGKEENGSEWEREERKRTGVRVTEHAGARRASKKRGRGAHEVSEGRESE